jgi:pimeloyl-ACP methyl ester carboxylesterase
MRQLLVREPPGRLVGPLWTVQRPGPGRPLVLLHGNGESHHVFDRLARALPGRALLAFDSRAHGRSPRGPGPLTIASMADDVAAALSALDLAAVDLLGFSDGGNIGLELALRHSGAVGRLLVCGANLDPHGLRAASLISTVLAHRGVTAASNVVPALTLPAELLALMAEQPRIDPQDLSRVRAPVLVVTGSHDVIRREHSELIARSLPAGRLAVIRHAGHSIPRTRPRQLAALVEGFFTP